MLPYKVAPHTMESPPHKKPKPQKPKQTANTRLKLLGTFKKKNKPKNIPLLNSQHRNNKNAHTTVNSGIKGLQAIPANTLFLVSLPRRPWQQQFLKMI